MSRCRLPALVTAAFLLSSTLALRADPLKVVTLRLGGRDFHSDTPPLASGHEVYVPVETLAALGLQGKQDDRGETIVVNQTLIGKRTELAIARPHGAPMLALSDIARLVNGVVDRWDAPPRAAGLPHTIPVNTVYLLAQLTDVRYADGALRVTTSFPVLLKTGSNEPSGAHQGYVECAGTAVPAGFMCGALSGNAVVSLRASQRTAESARVIAELSLGARIAIVDNVHASQTQIVAAITGGTGLTRTADSAVPVHAQSPAAAAIQPAAPKTQAASPTTQPAAPQASGQAVRLRTATPPPIDPDDRAAIATVRGTSGTSGRTGRGRTGSLPSRGTIHRQAAPVDVRAVKFSSLGDSHIELDVTTSGPFTPFVHYIPGTTHMAMEIPNGLLRLEDQSGAEQPVTHPLVSAVHVEAADPARPGTRVTIDTERILGYSVTQRADGASLDLRVPRSAGGALAGMLIVVDPGHGGTSSGATGHGDGSTVYEKDVTLAISLRLRAALESAGARVVMTRDHDVNVDLYDRPKLANGIDADLFVSVHNDSNGSPNSVSGTSTYYHLGDPSSRALADCVQQSVAAVTGLPSRGALSDGIMYAHGFAVLRASVMPAVLIEVAYINNAGDRRKLVDGDFQDRVARAICDGLRTYVEGGVKLTRNGRQMKSLTSNSAQSKSELDDDRDSGE